MMIVQMDQYGQVITKIYKFENYKPYYTIQGLPSFLQKSLRIRWSTS